MAKKVGDKVRSKGLRGWAHELVKGYGDPGDPGSGGEGSVGSSGSSGEGLQDLLGVLINLKKK